MYKGYTLRSGGAAGMDRAFEQAIGAIYGSSRKEIFYAADYEEWCLELVARYVPSDRPPLEKMKPFVQHLLARNMKQIFGHDGCTPVDFVVCWTPLGKDDGGTGYAIRAALDHGIPVYNLRNEEDRARFESDTGVELNPIPFG
jgi:hypothetical protein